MRNILKQLNFSSKETDVYLAALKLGSSSFTELSKLAGIKRPTTYAILEKLKERGLVSLSKKKGKQIFAAEDPEKLLKLLEEEKEAFVKKEEELKSALPKLKALTKKDTAMPIVRYYEGKENVWNIPEDLARSEQEAWIIAPGKIYDFLGLNRFFKKVTQERKRLGAKANIITDHNPEVIKAWKTNESFRDYRFMPKEIEMNAVVYIYASKISIIFLRDPLTGLTIENEELFKIFKFMFDSLWKELEGKNLPEIRAIEEAQKIKLK